EEVQEILGTPPRWIVRWGTTVAFITIGFLAILSYIIKYPDVIPATIVITTAIPPESVVAKTNAQISKILIEDRDTVEAGQLMAILQSTAEYEHVMRLEEETEIIKALDEEEILRYIPERGLVLGDIQVEYSAFITDFEKYVFNRESGFEQKTIQQLKVQIRKLEQNIINEEAKLRNAEEELQLERKTFTRKQSLYPRVTTKQELEDARASVVRKDREIKTYKSNIISYRLEKDKINEQILDILQESQELYANQFVRLKENNNRLRSSIDRWKQAHLIVAPKRGQVNYQKYERESRFVKIGEEVMAIVPEQGDSIVGKVKLPIRGSGKVEPKQKVIIKFDSYPYQEYGLISGYVEKKSLLPKGKEYLVEVSLPKLEGGKVVTSYNKELTFTQEMQGLAEIITEDRRFIERIFDKFLALFKDY
ncbi:MAG: hypothetical protein AAFP19_03260, partial [Bacteroidota bacterium]